MAIINGKEYAWSELEIFMSGKSTPLIGVVEIEYTTQQDHSEGHAKGRDPHHMKSGNKRYSGVLTVLQSELEAMQKTFKKGKDVTDYRGVKITVAYLPEDAGQPVTDVCNDCRFTEVKKGMRTGDGDQEIALPFKCLKINYDV